MAKTQEVYSIDDLFISINDIYAQFDGGKMDEKEAYQLALMCCREFINNHYAFRAYKWSIFSLIYGN